MWIFAFFLIQQAGQCGAYSVMQYLQVKLPMFEVWWYKCIVKGPDFTLEAQLGVQMRKLGYFGEVIYIL